MVMKFTEEQLNTLDKSMLIQMFMNQQAQMESLTKEVHSLNEKMQLMMEQLKTHGVVVITMMKVTKQLVTF